MEENLRPVTSPVNPDLADTEGCINELTRRNSYTPSSTVENTMDTSRWNGNARQGVWTNEKHNLYLDHLEASFIDQLNRSMGLLTSSKKLPLNTGTTSDQFTVSRDGRWRMINFEKNQHMLKIVSNSHSFLESPWTRHFRSECKIFTTRSDNLQEEISVPKEGIHSRGKRTFSQGLEANLDLINHENLQDSGDSLTEVSDQNFVDGNRNKKSSDISKAKRLKKAAEDSSCHDQVVPFGKFQVTEFSILGITSLEREEQICREWSLENAEGILQEHDVKPFLRES